MNTIELEFNKADTRIAGNPYGKEVFRTQVQNKIDYQTKNCIVFPDQIEKIASSFVQGFFSEVIKKVGYARFGEVITVKASSIELEKQIIEDLYF